MHQLLADYLLINRLHVALTFFIAALTATNVPIQVNIKS